MRVSMPRLLPLALLSLAWPGGSWAVEKTAAPAIDPVENLQGPYLAERRAAVEAIAGLPVPSQEALVPELLPLLDAENWQTQLHAAKALAAIGEPAAGAGDEIAQRLENAAERRDLAMVTLLARTLIRLRGGDPQEQQGLLTLLKTSVRQEDQALVDQMLAALGASGSEAVDDLVALLGHEEAALRRQAVLALRGLGNDAAAAVPALVAAAGNDPELRRDVEQTLKAVKASNTPPTMAAVQVDCIEGREVALSFAVEDPDDLADNLRVEVIEQPAHGELERQSPTAFIYHSSPGHTGEVRIACAASDGQDQSEPVAAIITVGKDRAPPVLLEVLGAGPDRLRLVFDEAVDPATASEPGTYALDGGIAVTSAEPSDDGRTVLLGLDRALSEGTQYQVTVTGIADRAETPNSATLQQGFEFQGDQPGLRYAFFASSDKAVLEGLSPDSGDPQRTGQVASFSLEPAGEVDSDFGIVFTGLIRITEAGDYTFSTTSDDGSALYIAGERVVDNGGWHGMEEKSGTVALQPGLHPIAVTMYQGSGGMGLEVHWQGPGIAKQVIPAEVLRHRPGEAAGTD